MRYQNAEQKNYHDNVVNEKKNTYTIYYKKGSLLKSVTFDTIGRYCRF